MLIADLALGTPFEHALTLLVVSPDSLFDTSIALMGRRVGTARPRLNSWIEYSGQLNRQDNVVHSECVARRHDDDHE